MADKRLRVALSEPRRRRREEARRDAPALPWVRRGGATPPVRRYVRDAGPLLDKLNQLTRADVTTRNERRAAKFQTLQDDLEERIARLAEQENLDALRPPLDGKQVMDRLGLEPGPVVGQALDFLMELRLERGPIPRTRPRRYSTIGRGSAGCADVPRGHSWPWASSPRPTTNQIASTGTSPELNRRCGVVESKAIESPDAVGARRTRSARSTCR